MKQLQKITALASMVALLVMSLVVVAPVRADNDLLEGASVALSDPRAGQSSSYTFTFTADVSASIEEIFFQWATTASGVTKPASTNLASATFNSGGSSTTGSGFIPGTNWAIDTTNAGSGLISIDAGDTNGQVIGDGTLTIQFDGITNSAITDCQAGVASSDTCFIRIQTNIDTTDTFDTTPSDNTNVKEVATVTYTTIQAVTVSATVDPSFTFVISTVAAASTIDTISTTVASTVTTLPFGNVSVGTVKYVAHDLAVTTNANSGYTVTMQMATQMAGTYTGNDIDPYSGSSATWADPKDWTSPTGSTANTDTAWIGAHVTDADISAFSGTEFGPVNGTANAVMSSSGPDDGSSSEQVVYALEANVYQPADIYSGTLIYYATPTY